MAKSIEEFLKMAAERRQQNQQGQNQPPRQRQREVIEIIDEVEIVEPLSSSSVGGHVRSHIDTSDIAEHTRSLGGRISSTDDAVEQRIHKKFDHSVGSLTGDSIADRGEVSAVSTSAYEAEDAPERATEIIELFRTPGSIRNAILINEILKRPDFDDE